MAFESVEELNFAQVIFKSLSPRIESGIDKKY